MFLLDILHDPMIDKGLYVSIAGGYFIDTHRTGESDKVQLSNFCILENKENGTLEIYLSKLGQFVGKPTYECETWKYTVYLPKEVE